MSELKISRLRVHQAPYRANLRYKTDIRAQSRFNAVATSSAGKGKKDIFEIIAN